MPEFMDAHALVTGVGDYLHPSFASLPATIRDAQAIVAILTDLARCGYPASNVHVLTGLQATANDFRAALQSLAQETNPRSTVFIYFSGHGGRALENGVWRTYLCLRQANQGDLSHTAISGDEFSILLATIPVHKLLIVLDTCHAAGSVDFKASDSSLFWKAGLPSDYYEAPSRLSERKCHP